MSKNKPSSRLWAHLCVACIPFLAWPAWSFTALQDKDIPKAIKAIEKRGMLATKQFDAGHGLRGWVIKNGARSNIAYSIDGKDILISGSVLDETGENISKELSELHIERPDYMQAVKEFSTSATFALGSKKAPAEAFVIIDPMCFFCKKIHQVLAYAIAAGELRVTYIPVGLMSEKSIELSAGMLEQKNKIIAMNLFANNNGIASKDKRLIQKIKDNNSVLAAHNITSVPMVIFKDKQGKSRHLQAINRLPEMFEKLGIDGQLNQARKNPDLAKLLP